MKRLDVIEERLLPIQSLEERLTALEISVWSPPGRQELPAACVPAHTPEQGQDGRCRDFCQADRGEEGTRGVPCLAARKAGTEEPAATGTVTWDRIRRRAAREEGGRAQTSRRTARAEGGRALNRRQATRVEGGGTFIEWRPTVVSRRAGVCGGPARVLAPPSPVARRQVHLAAVTVAAALHGAEPP
ncbi:hypothetical protein GUJ93_ZPchr0013g35237 [Zizania palustris]|uniref:Uncharacterized protein n=1 Tax=Zizania palustris TaxID=103762 RepID=A0A8J5X403_ZIZPA|nr:hypothetical protein GUJ93_ZPchr0013g35237 [Zizania palustris]